MNVTSHIRDVAVLVGSLRPDGQSARLAHAMKVLAPPSLRLEDISIRELPLYDPAFEPTLPMAVSEFRDALAAVDAVLFVTPEYNRSIPGVLKNAIDIASRPYGEGALQNKPVAIVSQSPGAAGGMAASLAIRQSLVCLGVLLLPQPEVYIGASPALIGPGGELKDEGIRCLLSDFLRAFSDWIPKGRAV